MTASDLLGNCADCGRGIPVGYLAFVTKWVSVAWGQLKCNKPVEMYCRECAVNVSPDARYKRRLKKVTAPVLDGATQEENEPDLTLKDIALRVLRVMSREKAMSSRRLSELSELGEDYIPEIKQVLHKLRDAGKVEFDEEEKRWLLC